MSERLTQYIKSETVPLPNDHGIQIPKEYEDTYYKYYNPTNTDVDQPEDRPPDSEFSEEIASSTTFGTIYQMTEVVSQTTPGQHWSKLTNGGRHRGPGSYEKNKSEKKTNRDNRIRGEMNK